MPHGHISTALTALDAGLVRPRPALVGRRGLDQPAVQIGSSAPLTSGEHSDRKATIQQTYFVSRIPSSANF